MKVLSDILFGCPILRVQGPTHLAVGGISINSKTVKKDDVFIAIRGHQSDGHQFISQAVEKGAVAIVCEQWPVGLPESVTVIQVQDARKSAGIIASSFFEDPSRKLHLIGITGTNGKTTNATLLHYYFQQKYGNAGLISTVVNKIRERELPASLTTPDPVSLNELLHEMIEQGCTHAAMEVSSIALDQKRTEGISFAGAVFTNLTHDHLDYHKTFENYRDAKKLLFDSLPSSAFALVNKDDKNGMYMVQNTRAKVYTYSLHQSADFTGRIMEKDFSGMEMRIQNKEFHTRLTGTFNAYNLLSVYAAACLSGEDPQEVLTILSLAEPVRGRFQYYRTQKGVTGIVDYAHTPDALENVLVTIQDILKGDEKIITVVGCGGNRDASKRPVMGKIASRYSHRVILTSDNPRDEDPDEIIRQMLQGISAQDSSRVMCMKDRREAIRAAYEMADAGDVVLIAGKGHETYQEIRGVKHPFDDMEEWKKLDKQKV